MTKWIVVAILSFAPVLAFGQCAFAFAGVTGGVSNINFTTLGTPPPNVPASSVSDAISVWAYGCSSGYGYGFPSMTEGPYSNTAGTMNVYLVYHQLPNTSPSGRCGYADVQVSQTTGEIEGAMIHMYPQQSNGVDCTAAWTNLIAHEMGHVLGLGDVDGDSRCNGTIMGANPSHVSDDQCDLLKDNWSTPAEEEIAACGFCPYPCSGSTCPTDSGGGGDNGPGCTVNCSPLILDLDGDGIETTTLASGVEFDISGDGVMDRTAWTKRGAEDAFLYFDHDRNGVIDGGGELFGEATVLPNGALASNGFEALASYDRELAFGGNGDGVISPRDGVWGRLRLWVDRNHDGRMTADENYSLSERHILSLDLSYMTATAADRYGIDEAGNHHLYQGSFTLRDTRSAPPRNISRAMTDVFFKIAPR